MFVNISNHASAKWSGPQLDAAKILGGEVRDINFPNVPAMASPTEVLVMADAIVAQVQPGDVVMVQGEFSLTFAITQRLLSKGTQVVVACSERRSVDQPNPDGSVTKTSVFDFAQFRPVA